MKKRIYFENLDGLRFLCFLSVFLFHSFHTESAEIQANWFYQFLTREVFANGNLGVNFFFVLSGFLITYLLIQEKKLNGQIHLKKFWIRRILRIWPLYYFSVFFGFVIFAWLKQFFGETPNETADPLYYVTFISNFDLLRKGLPDASILGVLWSVAIEEQFYLLWPIILFMFPIKRYWIPFTILIVSSLTFRALNDTYMLHEFHTLSCIGDMTIGAFGAWAMSEFKVAKDKISNLKKPIIALIYISFLLIYFFRDEVLFANYGIRIFERAIIASIMLLIILEQNYAKNSFFKMSSFKTISKLGVITYGLYCLHFIGILAVTKVLGKYYPSTELWQVIIVETTLALTITIIISKLSYKYFEQPFLRLKNRFAYITK
jgi:peptidoglycan/LPS O-acetylase OafA/YrhL